ncbi:GTP 3',8-cyclase MoaA [Syntrophomonas palmitatica]|uniref:GTP 3',8-cyclase MoaA n=1 Tax=Syntrophomonas palmitatica TaxID=402877 RepID=UPI0006D2685E|nr:GTP 3',8-cyclase MoaA [Syntrophomonas palmitatica]
MRDRFEREINYLRISITDRCNLRCRYCMPEDGVEKMEHSSILNLEEMARLVNVAAQAGIHKVRLTGGEPLVRRNISQLIRYIAGLSEIDDIGITTNGILFGAVAEELQQAGLKRVNFSLDSLKSERFRYLTRCGDLEAVKKSIFKAIDLNMHPVKINTVIIGQFNDDEILDFADLAYNYPVHIRFIEFMPVGDLRFWKKERVVSSEEIKSRIESRYKLITARRIAGNGPAKYYQIENGQGSIGFISPMSNHFCGECNRIRLTADGRLRACLYDKTEVDLKTPLRNGASDAELLDLFRKCISKKPAHHEMSSGWGIENERKMYQIGG